MLRVFVKNKNGVDVEENYGLRSKDNLWFLKMDYSQKGTKYYCNWAMIKL